MSSQSANVVISLDALDLNFLKKRFEQNFGTSLNQIEKNLYFNENNYYEFEVKTHEDLGILEESIKNQEEIEYIQCHICKIDIPQQFYYEHRNSTKHEINIKIANEAVQRLQNHVSCHYDTNSSINKSLNYFCPVCAITMGSIEKDNHENTVGHKNSVIVEKFLKDFLSIYSNEAYDHNHSLKFQTSTATTMANKSTIETKKSHAQDKINKNAENDTEKSTSNASVNKPNITGLRDYIIFLKGKYEVQETQFKAINDSTLEITTIDKSVVRVNADSFHGFKELGTRFTRCTICKDIFDTSIRQQHLLTEHHMELVWCLPLRNKDCIRYITDSWHHCVLCNEGIEDSTSHVWTTEHLNNIKMFLFSENKQNNIVSLSQLGNVQPLYSTHVKDTTLNTVEKEYLTKDINQEIIPVSLTSPSVESNGLDTDLRSDEIKNDGIIKEKQFCSFCNVLITIKGFPKHSKTIKHNMNTLSDFHYLMACADTDNYVCIICGNKVTNSIEDVKQHTTLQNHIQMYNTLLQNNGIRQINKIKFFCTPCNDTILIKNELLHINSREHKMLCGENNNVTVDKTLSTVPSPEDMEDVTSLTKDDLTVFFCNICSVNVPNTKQNIKIHIKGRPHIKNMQKLFHKKSPETDTTEHKRENNSIVGVSEVRTNNTSQKLPFKHTYFEKTQDSSILKCIVCDIFLTNNEGNLATHVKGLNHKNSYYIILERNCIEINGIDIFCKTCSVHISIGNEIQHCKGKKHIQNLSPADISSD